MSFWMLHNQYFSCIPSRNMEIMSIPLRIWTKKWFIHRFSSYSHHFKSGKSWKSALHMIVRRDRLLSSNTIKFYSSRSTGDGGENTFLIAWTYYNNIFEFLVKLQRNDRIPEYLWILKALTDSTVCNFSWTHHAKCKKALGIPLSYVMYI